MANESSPPPPPPPDFEPTFIYSGPLFLQGPPPGAELSRKLVGSGSEDLKKNIKASGVEKFEHLVLYCLKLLHAAQGKICAFYLDDFDRCTEPILKMVQELMGNAGYVTSDFLDPTTKQYKGFWAWHKTAAPKDK